jgi:hypothetical protein
MLIKPALRPVSAQVIRKLSEFRSNEDGAMAIFVLFAFVMMLLFGGIAVDVMRFEMRRVALQETMDRATLAASNVVLPVTQTPQAVALEWFNTSGIGADELEYEYSTPVITGEATTSSRKAKITSKVRSYNWFMHMLGQPYFEGPTVSSAQQGVSKIEVIMALDITGSMAEASGSTTKIEALRKAATNFVTILKFSKDASNNYTIAKDPNQLISIGMVPYSSNVNIPVELRDQFTVSHLSSWDGIANQGVPGVNCFEIPESTYGSLPLSRTDPIPMMAVAQTGKSNPGVNITTIPNHTRGGIVERSYTAPAIPSKNTNSFTCNHGDNFNTSPKNESASNLVAMPTTNITALKTQIEDLNPRGFTSIAVGMRWATALIDQSARDIYTAIIPAPVPAPPGGGNPMAGRPANNSATDTRKIIVLMTDGDHVPSKYVLDAYKSGPSPIWRGTTDGRMAIEYNDSGVGLTGGTRPGIAPSGNPVNSCSGWSLANTVVNGNVVKRNFFVPHLKASAVRRTTDPNRAEGNGNTGSDITGACDPRAWLAPVNGAPTWTGSGPVVRLDWSEVWRYASVDWVVEQLFMRSNVTGATNYETVYNTMVGDYLVGDANMDALLSTNCTAAKQAGVEVFGIVLGNNVNEAPVKSCSSSGTGYYYRVTNADDLNAAFEQIAVLISELRLTQ